MISRWAIFFSSIALVAAGPVTGRVELRESHDPAVRKRLDYSGVVISLKPPAAVPAAARASGSRAVMRQKGKTFSPHVLAISVGSSVDFPNLDPIFHSAFSNYSGQVFDLGQNINGWVRLRELGPAGTAITLTHGEAVDADGDVTTAHLDVDLPFIEGTLSAGQVDHVVSAGRPGDSFEPRHTTHGFQYVRVEGHPGELGLDDLSGVVVHTDMTRTGSFRCSDDRINRLHDASVWSFRGNACDIPTDCPTRERAGWTGDWQVFVSTAAFLYDVAGFSTKWLRDLAAEQWSSGVVANLAPSPPPESEGGFMAGFNGSAGWGDAAVIVPWEIFRAYGDRRVLEEQWPSMVRWLEYVERSAAAGRHPDRVARDAEPRGHERYLWDTGFHWGEWLEPGADLKGPEEFEAFRRADKADVATAYFAHSLCQVRVLIQPMNECGR